MLHAVWNALAKGARDQLVFLWSSVSLATVVLLPVGLLALPGERIPARGPARLALVVAGVAGLHLTAPWRGGARPPASGAGTAWALLTGLLIASYSIVDKAGVARLHPLPYIGLMGLGMSALLVPVVLRDRAALAREWRENWQTIVVAAAMKLTSYLLVLFPFRLSEGGLVVAARESSIPFSAFIGSLWLGEGPLLPRLAGASIVLAGVVCVALAY